MGIVCVKNNIALSCVAKKTGYNVHFPSSSGAFIYTLYQQQQQWKNFSWQNRVYIGFSFPFKNIFDAIVISCTTK